jgi:hypothetical protein
MMERLLEVSIDSRRICCESILSEVLETTRAEQMILLGRYWRWRRFWSNNDGSEATQAAGKALTPDVFHSGSNKAALNFEVASDKASSHLHRFVKGWVVADTWLGDYKMGYKIMPLLLTKDRKQPRLIDTTTTARTKCRRLSEVAPLVLPLLLTKDRTLQLPLRMSYRLQVPVSSVATTADNISKQKLTATTTDVTAADVTTASRRKKTARRIIARIGRLVFFVKHVYIALPCIISSS